MGDDFNFFLPDELLNDSDSDGENVSDPAVELGSSTLPQGFVPSAAAADFADPGPGYPPQSRLLPGIANANPGLRPGTSSHRYVPCNLALLPTAAAASLSG